MLSLLIVLILTWNFYIGYSRGIILQSFYVLGALLSLLVANRFYIGLAHKLTLWIPYSNPVEGTSVFFFKSVDIFVLDKVYYAGLAFFIIFLLGYVLSRFLGIFVHFLLLNYFDNQWTKCLSGGLAFLVSLLFLNMLLSIFATVPMPFLQHYLHSSFLTRLVIEHLPPLTIIIQKLWIQAII
ncbi:colicin V production family protein [Streptococcus pyogenes]|uniref:CvpA family protein n=1 Tax=Streptococcus pyogenes TaxID=1314 RepID=UPI0010A10578|nr:CvpA family protein [Streptococcus pyogenes]VGU36991.1 colicin V production family protein [Streptococcus pyogenes]